MQTHAHYCRLSTAVTQFANRTIKISDKTDLSLFSVHRVTLTFVSKLDEITMFGDLIRNKNFDSKVWAICMTLVYLTTCARLRGLIRIQENYD